MPLAPTDDARLRESAAGVNLSEWAALELTGEDRLEWLQGQATGDVRGLTEGNRRSFCLCEPTGQLLAVVDAWALPDRIVMTTARARSEAVLARIERMTIMEDVLGAEARREGFSIQGPATSRELGKLLSLPTHDAGIAPFEGADVWVLRSNRTAAGGWDVWAPGGTSLPELFSPLAPEAYEAARIEAGIPKWGQDMGPKTLPPELGAAFEAAHVDYDKGCYTGQEILMRMHSRGHTNKTWVGLVATTPLVVGAEVAFEGKVVGTVASAAGPIGAATLRNEALQGPVLIGGERVEVRRMPLAE